MPRAFSARGWKVGETYLQLASKANSNPTGCVPLGGTVRTAITNYTFIAIDTACQENYNFTL